MSWDWLTTRLLELPRCGDPFFRLLWQSGRLCYGPDTTSNDLIDYLDASLVCAALDRGVPILIRLPDAQERRAPLLFASALIMTALDHMRAVDDYKLAVGLGDADPGAQLPPYRVIYFGSTVGIRRQLAGVEVRGGMQLNLGDVFQQSMTVGRRSPQVRPTRRGRGRASQEQGVALPHVLCAYSPADPVNLLETYTPQWIAVDCANAVEMPWLPAVLRYSRERSVPLIAWAANPMIVNANDLDGMQMFAWAVPASRLAPTLVSLHSNAEALFTAGVETAVEPILMGGPAATTLSERISSAAQYLVRAARSANGNLSRDALAVHWGYIRSLETLTTPHDLYETEAPRVWGMRSFREWRLLCERFRDAVSGSQPQVASCLAQVSVELDLVEAALAEEDHPLWTSLASMCCGDRERSDASVVVFTTEARKRLFSLAMLARHNLSEEDLQRKGLWFASLGDVEKVTRSEAAVTMELCSFATVLADAKTEVVLVGLPSPTLWKRMTALLQRPNLGVLLLDHQLRLLDRRVNEWNRALSFGIEGATTLLSSLTNAEGPPASPSLPSRVRMKASRRINTPRSSARAVSAPVPRWEQLDALVELTELLGRDYDEIEDEEQAEAAIDAEDGAATSTQSNDQWCDTAVRVEFDEGWCGTFAPDETVNVVVAGRTGEQVRDHFVRSLQPGQRVIMIHGQRRQSLYDLVESRIHGHPAIELHLALVRRWQSDLRQAYSTFRASHASPLDAILQEMRILGSGLTSTQTLRLWLRGQVLCPDDPEDLRRLSLVLKMPFVTTYYRRIYTAKRRLHGLHITLSRRINRWLQQQVDTSIGNISDVLDEELGLTFDDIATSLLVLRVASIATIPGPFLRSRLGTLRRDSR